ncbi:hypothetical protein ES706_00039 [subsurface metagenome]|nr:hypothetical protein [Hadesarchaea archaeon]
MADKFQEARELLKRLDSQTLDRRAERLAELEPIVFNGGERRSDLMWNFMKEASKTYEIGCFRSCIFYCAGAVEYTLRHELTRLLGSSVKALKKIEDEDFNDVIKKAEGYEKLQPFAEDADYLRRLRNKIAAHPLQLPSTELRTREEIEIERETAIRDIKIFMEFLDSGDGELKEMEELIENPEALDSAIGWQLYADKLLRKLAFKAWRIMRAIINGLYPVRDT